MNKNAEEKSSNVRMCFYLTVEALQALRTIYADGVIKGNKKSMSEIVSEAILELK